MEVEIAPVEVEDDVVPGKRRTRQQAAETEKSKKPAAVTGRAPAAAPLMCVGAEGVRVPMYQADVALITYEQLRKEIGSGSK